MKRSLFISGLLLMLILTGCSSSQDSTATAIATYDIETPYYVENPNTLNDSSTATVKNASEEGLFSTKAVDKNQQIFTNNASGYSVTLPSDLKVVDMGDATYRSTLANDTTRLEIFAQPLKDINAETYLEYSNKFLENTHDFKKLIDEETNDKNRTTHLLSWDRRVLKKVPNDRNHYGVVDIIQENTDFCFLLTSTEPISKKTLQSIADSIQFTKPTVEAKEYPRFVYKRDNLTAETQEFYDQYFSSEASLTWGIFEPFNNTAKVKDLNKFEKDLTTLEKELDYKFKILLYYSDTAQDNNVYETLNKFWELGGVTELTLQTPLYDPTAENNAVYEILDGKRDDNLHKFAQDVARFGHPVLFRPFNEMNGDWCTYSAYWAGRDCSTYVDLYRYVYDIFEQEGANKNTLWVWNPNERSFPDFGWNAIDNYYPGDEYVDIVGLTGYNTGDHYDGEIWREFKEIYEPIYNIMEPQYQQPFMITEFSCSNIGGDKAAWVNDMFTQLAEYPRIKAAVWWNNADFDTDGSVARSYYIDDNEKAFDEFKEHLSENK